MWQHRSTAAYANSEMTKCSGWVLPPLIWVCLINPPGPHLYGVAETQQFAAYFSSQTLLYIQRCSLSLSSKIFLYPQHIKIHCGDTIILRQLSKYSFINPAANTDWDLMLLFTPKDLSRRTWGRSHYLHISPLSMFSCYVTYMKKKCNVFPQHLNFKSF